MNGATSQSSKLFQLLTPGLTFNFDPKEATWGNNIIMSGNFNTIASRNSVFFDNVQATIVSTSSKELKIQVPAALSKIKTNIIYKATPFTMVATDTFRLKGPVINSFSPVSGPSNADITIKGKYFSSGNTTIKFGTTSGVITSMNDSTLIVKVPAGIHGPVKIIITVKLQSVTSSSDFIATNPKINSISPLSGTFNDEVTIEGEDFIPLSGNTTVTFGGIPATIKSINDTKAIVLVPLTLDSIPKTVVLTAGSISTSSPVVYTLASPVIISITPEESVPGLDVKITGVNFNPVTENNQVYLDGYPMVIKNGNANEIIATLPLGLARGDFKIKIITGGYSRFSAQKLRINSQWLKILTPQLLTTIQRRKNGMAIYGASLNGLGYFCSPASVMMYEFEPVNKTWTKMDLQTPYEYLQLMGQVVHKDKFYLIAGEQMGWEAFGINLLSFNKENGWQSRLLPAIMSDRGGVAFSLNNKIYFGLKWDIDNSEFWECDPNNNYTWLMKATCPAISSQFFSTYFSLAGKGYVLYHDRNLWEYDPVADSWTLKSQFPGQMRFEAISFVIGEFAYLGTGSENFNSKPYDDIWKYDPVSNSWTLVTHMPVARRSAVAITINNKAYIGYGIDGSDFDLYDFYEFDPNYPLK
jgi:hypothetical protein